MSLRTSFVLLTVFALSTLTFGQQGHSGSTGQRGGPPTAAPGAVHSNAPSNTPAASSDRDVGKDRAEDVGKGKKEGLETSHTKKRPKKHATEAERTGK